MYKFVKNDRKRVTVACEHKKDKGGAWRLHASPMTHTMTFSIKAFNGVHTRGTGMDSDGHKRASRKWVASLLQMQLKQCSTYPQIDVRKDFKAQLDVQLKYTMTWWGKQIAQTQLYHLTRQNMIRSCDKNDLYYI